MLAVAAMKAWSSLSAATAEAGEPSGSSPTLAAEIDATSFVLHQVSMGSSTPSRPRLSQPQRTERIEIDADWKLVLKNFGFSDASTAPAAYNSGR